MLVNRKERGFTLIEILIVISIIVILMGFVMSGIQYAYVRAYQGVAANFVNALSTGLDNFYLDEGYYPGVKVDPDDNAFPELFEALMGEKRPKGGGRRSAPYVEAKEKDIYVEDEETGEYRAPTYEERWDKNVSKIILDPWGNPFWYRANMGRERAEWMRRPLKADIWSMGTDKLNSNIPSAFEDKSDDIGNWY